MPSMACLGGIDIIIQLVTKYWAIGSLIIAAALTFVAAIFTGSLIDLIACLACMVGLAGVVKLVD
jgi:hypothetical protein